MKKNIQSFSQVSRLINFSVIFNFLRVKQWYKNIVIVLGLVFAPGLVSFENIILIGLGFIALCFISSANYIRNDISDVERDKQHPAKKNRPLPSGALSIKQAYAMFIIVIIIGLTLGFSLSINFGMMILGLFLVSEAYTRWLKRIIILDVFTLGVNFIIRAVSGIVLLQSSLSPWIIMGVFFVALLLGFIKRKAEFESLGEDRSKHRKTLEEYSVSSLNSFVLLSAILVIVTYSIYSLTGTHDDWRLTLTVPIMVFVIYRQIHLSSINHPLVQTNDILKDKISIVTMLVFAATVLYIIYFVPSNIFSKVTF